MFDGNDPLIQLESGGSAPILGYGVPQPSGYFGRNFVELEYADDVFTEPAWERPDRPQREPGEANRVGDKCAD